MTRLIRSFVPSGVLTVMLLDALILCGLFYLATYLTMDVDPSVYLLYDGGMARILLVAASAITGLYLQDLYSRARVKSRIKLAQQLCLVMGSVLLLQGLIGYISPSLKLPIEVMLLGISTSMVALFVWRAYLSPLALEAMGNESLLMVGPSPVLDDLAAFVTENPTKGLAVLGFVRDGPPAEGLMTSTAVLGPIAQLREIAEEAQPDRILVGSSENAPALPVEELLKLRFAGYVVENAATARERLRGRVSLAEIRPLQLVSSGELGTRPQHIFYQRLLNILVALAGIVAFSPVMLLTAIAVKLSSKGPLLYCPLRVGLNDIPFRLLKFRSMSLAGSSPGGPRVTGVGRFLRAWRLDDFPQLFNVLKGDMSIVGPRPERPEFAEALASHLPFYRHRHRVRPGITGWAQLNCIFGNSYRDSVAKLESDLNYIKHMSLGLDTFIMLRGIKSFLLTRAA